MHRQSRSRLAATVGSVLLTLAAIGGMLCIVAVIAATFFHVSLILFRTGSMSPTIPAGSVALVRQVPADQVHVGDVVTVDRPGELPITHRIVATVPAANGAVALTLRGDANPQDDPAPYLVSHVRLVSASLPGAAPAIVFLSNPIVLGSITVAAALLVGWAFWPGRRSITDVDVEIDGGDDSDDTRDDLQPPHGSGRHRGASGAGVASVIAALALTLAIAAPTPARAATTQTIVSSRYFTLTSIADSDEFAALTPGHPVRWVVGVNAHPPSPALIHLGLSASGELAGPSGLLVSIVACTTRWAGADCAGQTTPLLAQQTAFSALSTAAANGVRELGSMPSAEQRWLAVDVTLPTRHPPGSADLRIHASGAGDEAQTASPTETLTATGSSFPGLAAALAFAAIATGSGAARIARRHRRATTR